jgi:arylsulfatase
MGPFDHWPHPGGGFEYFYGFIGGETNQYYPALYEFNKPVEPDKTPEEGYHLNDDLADKAITWVRQQQALIPDKPFFLYVAPGATHAPHHVPTEWSAKYRGQFDQGWDRLREQTFARQKGLGIIPLDGELTARHAEIPAWEEIPAELQPVLARQMEIYAGFLEHTDYHVGRLVDTLQDLGVLEDTLVFYIIGDNGASAEGDLHGSFNELINLNGAADLQTTEFMASHIDDFGTPKAFNHYAVGWAHAMCTPYQWTKQVASHWGGTRNGTIVHWPTGMRARGEVRTQFHHVIDVAPTVLEAAGLPEPTLVHGVQQAPLEGVSMVYSFDAAAAGERHTTQYFEVFCNRGIYHQGWSAVTKHRTPWVLAAGTKQPAFDDDVWEPYDGSKDWTQAHDLAQEMPQRLHELQRLVLIEAAKYNVLPLDDRTVERANSDLAGRPTLVRGDSQLLFGGMGRLSENSVLKIKNKSHTVTAEVVVPAGVVSGVIVAQGGAFGGWSLYVRDSRPAYCYNLFGLRRFTVEGMAPLLAGTHEVRMAFAYDGGGFGRGGTVTLSVNGSDVGQGRVEGTVPMVFSADETLDIGVDSGSPVSDAYTATASRFPGTVNWVRIELGGDDHSHLIAPEQHLKVAMTRQ